MTCLETLRKAFPKASDHCFDQKLAVEEKGRKFRIELKKGSDETFCRAQIDGCAIDDDTVEKCDSLFLRCKTEDFLFVELKGKDVKKGFSQLLSTILLTKPFFKFQKRQVHGFIVSSRVPNGADVQNMKAEFRKNHGHRLEVKNGIWVEKVD